MQNLAGRVNRSYIVSQLPLKIQFSLRQPYIDTLEALQMLITVEADTS